MAKTRNSQDLDNVFEALANIQRREIIYVLSLEPCSISKLAFLRNLSLPAIHKHIEILEKGGIVTRRKIGQTNFLTLNRESLRGLQDWLIRINTTEQRTNQKQGERNEEICNFSLRI